MKKFIVTKEQLNEYVNIKKSEKIFYDIVEAIHLNNKLLKENISKEKANQTIIDNYMRKGLINTNVSEMLIKYHVTDNVGFVL